MRLPAIILLAITFLFWGLYYRYQPDGPLLLKNPSMADATVVRGDCTETNGRFVLCVPEGGDRARIDFRMAGATNYHRIRVRGRIRTDRVVEGKYSWRCARLMLVQYDEQNRWVPGHHSAGSVKGTKPWKLYEDVFEVMPKVAHVEVAIEQLGISGTAEFEYIEAQPVRVRTLDPFLRLLFGGCWIAMGILYFSRCRLNTRKLRILILLNVLAIITGALMPERWIKDSTESFRQMIVKVTEKPVKKTLNTTAAEKTTKPIRKTKQESLGVDRFNDMVGGAHRYGHIVLFASLCFLVYCSAALEHQHPSYYFRVAFDIFIFAGITEALQHLTLDRTAGIKDILCDVYGMGIALIAFMLLRPLLMRKKEASHRAC